ncbi:hypothetical protein KSP40_PGU003712 [Platanthera guangdongensis]|uniref:Uncharacterized protein n=1 Tax=Platanthera guangdongensis TaxID=2320717 RepID=A0ABR2LUT0_9ASPA
MRGTYVGISNRYDHISAVECSILRKIQFRSKKIRKSSSPSSAIETIGLSKKPRILLPVITHQLSTPGELNSTLRRLTTADSHLTGIIKSHDPPPSKTPTPPSSPFPTASSTSSSPQRPSASIYTCFLSLCGGEDSVVPDIIAALTPHQLCQIGIEVAGAFPRLRKCHKMAITKRRRFQS